MKYRVQLRFIEPYQVDVEAKDMEQARRKAKLQALEETYRTGVEYDDVEVEIECVSELG